MKEIIEQKLTELSAQKEELLARLNAVIGAEQVLKDILGKEVSDHERSDAVGD
ncbi:MAG: hypothetical protein IKW76_11015 [Clostridia bacterium]|nr:hypothetical protein [Clostridia bacterium]